MSGLGPERPVQDEDDEQRDGRAERTRPDGGSFQTRRGPDILEFIRVFLRG